MGLNDVVIGEGNTYQEALTDVIFTIYFHLKTYGNTIVQEYMALFAL